ncbi:MAG: enoyl-[acyl-carrier protein] reductase I [Chloroflexi bacterium]|nr:MAG: enoyl-[acyl-carrier protein] reductase I [Chloroflexota bacterium]
MYTIDLSGKFGVVFGVSNHRSIAWSIARILGQAGMTMAVTYQNERFRDGTEKLAAELEGAKTFECDVSTDDAIANVFSEIEGDFGALSVVVHSLAFAQRDELGGAFLNTSRAGFNLALEVSAYSLIPIAKYAAPLLERGEDGNIIAMTFQASERVFPGYNVMGTAKAALENEVRHLASDLGPQNIRVNAISAGPLDTLAARGIPRFMEMKKAHQERSPLRRNITHEEVAKTALYLCSDLSSGVTGAVIPVDSGYHIMGI